MGFFRISKTQNLSIGTTFLDLNIDVISLYDLDTVSPVRVEIWKENIFSFFYHFVELSFIFCFHFCGIFTPPPHVFQTKKLITITLFMIFNNKNGVEQD